MAKSIIGKVGITPKGDYSNTTQYKKLDVVTFEGSSYVCLKDCKEIAVTNTEYWQLMAKHGEFTEQQLEDFKVEVVAESKDEMDDYTAEKKAELDTYEGTKEAELDTYESAKETELNTYASGLKDAFDTNATSKTNAFNTNAISKTTDFDNNATAKTTAFDENAEEKTGDFNDNVDTKTAEFDAHVVEKEAEFDENVDSIQEQITDIQEFIDSELEQGITEKDTRADVSDSAKWYGELAPEGRTEQKQLSGKNLFNPLYLSIEEGYNTYDESTGMWTTNNGNNYNRSIFQSITGATATPNVAKLPKLSAGTYSILFNDLINNTSSSIAYALYDSNGDMIGSIVNTTANPFTLEVEEEAYLDIKRRASSGTFSFSNIQIEQGSTATDYEPYCGGQTSPNPDYPQEIRNVEGNLDFAVCNKNLAWQGWAEDCVARVGSPSRATIEEFEGRECLYYLPVTGYGDYDNKYLFKTNFKDNTQYTFAFDLYNTEGTKANMRVNYTDGSTQNVADITSNAWEKVIFTTAENKTVKYITSAYFSGNKYLDLNTFMVLEGVYTSETLPKYVANQQQLIPFPLAEGQKLMEGSYLADDGVHYNYIQKILNGTEEWQILSSAANYTQFSIPRSTLANAKVRGKVLSNCFIQTKNDRADFNNVYVGNNYFNVCPDNSVASTVEGFKSWLADKYSNNNPVMIQYETSSEVIDPYTEAQQEAYNKLKKLMLNQGVNHIWTETDGLEPNLQLTYYKSNKQRLNNIEARLELLEN